MDLRDGIAIVAIWGAVAVTAIFAAPMLAPVVTAASVVTAIIAIT